MPAIQNGDARLMGFVGDEVFYQFGAAFTAGKTTNEATREYHDVLTGADGKVAFGPGSSAIVETISKNRAVCGSNRAGHLLRRCRCRFDMKDIQHQIGWFKSQGMVKGDVDAERRSICAMRRL